MTDGSAGPETWPLPARWVETLGRVTLYLVESLGRFGRFLGGLLGGFLGRSRGDTDTGESEGKSQTE